MSDQLPNVLSDSERLSKAIWEHWTSILRTDQHDTEWPDWDTVDNAWKDSFMETVDQIICGPISRFTASRPTPPVPTPPMYRQRGPRDDVHGGPCYICARNPVSYPGEICDPCWNSHVAGVPND